MTTAFVLSGGGSLGAIQVGMLKALADIGIKPDALVGTSAGALNAAWVAAHGMTNDSLDKLDTIWTELRRTDIFPVDIRQVVRAALGLSHAVSSAQRLGRLVAAHADVENIEDTDVPLHLLATDLLAGTSVLIDDGPLVEGVLASSAIPGIFPPVNKDSRPLVDGVVSGQSGVAQAVALGATTIYVLPTGAACALPKPPRSAIGVALHALTTLIERRLANEMAAYADAATIKVLPALCPLSVSPADFGHAAELIARSHQASREWIADGAIDLPAPERFLSAHHHRSTAARARH
ncbi:MAG TPA: patatin-like phospholipase family protein [Nocardioidaceae bacterium]|nr:patatin-like phospholipase family protein [Nocardioidaceae bacterium]